MNLRGSWGTVIGPGMVWGLAVSGHELIQVVMPVHAAAFGVTLPVVGFLLSINKIIRVIGYGWVVALGRRVGPRGLMLIASASAAGTTFVYAWCDGWPALTAARLIWGLGFAALNLGTLMYAMSIVEGAGTRVGLTRSLGAIGPALVLGLGSAAVGWLGPREVFVAVGLFMALAIPLAWALPPLAVAEEPAGRRRLSQPTVLDLFYFMVGFAIDGLFVMTVALMFLDRYSVETAVLSGGLLLGVRYIAAIVVSPFGGWLGDRFGAWRLQILFGLLFAAGFGLTAFGLPVLGGVVIVSARAVLAVLGNLVIAQRDGGGSMVALSRLATWTDMGGAVGPMLIGTLIPVFGLQPLYGVGAVLLTLSVAVLAWRGR